MWTFWNDSEGITFHQEISCNWRRPLKYGYHSTHSVISFQTLPQLCLDCIQSRAWQHIAETKLWHSTAFLKFQLCLSHLPYLFLFTFDVLKTHLCMNFCIWIVYMLFGIIFTSFEYFVTAKKKVTSKWEIFLATLIFVEQFKQLMGKPS